MLRSEMRKPAWIALNPHFRANLIWSSTLLAIEEMLNIRIFDVDHGFCAAVHTGDHQRILIDCGYNRSCNGFNPTRYFLDNGIRRLNYLIMPSFIEGHLEGFYDLIGNSLNNCFSIGHLLINPSIDADSLPELMIRNFNLSHHEALKFLSGVRQRCGNVERTIHLGKVELSFFWNTYPEFLDFHNLSLVTFLSYEGFKAIFPGNLKTAGWRALLRNHRFREQLRQVNLFIASNHGQADGYCLEVFNYCNPDMIIVSNDYDQILSHRVVQQYEQHIHTEQKVAGQSNVLTTSRTGTIAILKAFSGAVQVITQRSKIYPLKLRGVYQN